MSPLWGSHSVISAEVNFQIAYKIADFGYPLCVGKGSLCNKERQPLLLKYFIIFPHALMCYMHKSVRILVTFDVDDRELEKVMLCVALLKHGIRGG